MDHPKQKIIKINKKDLNSTKYIQKLVNMEKERIIKDVANIVNIDIDELKIKLET